MAIPGLPPKRELTEAQEAALAAGRKPFASTAEGREATADGPPAPAGVITYPRARTARIDAARNGDAA